MIRAEDCTIINSYGNEVRFMKPNGVTVLVDISLPFRISRMIDFKRVVLFIELYKIAADLKAVPHSDRRYGRS